MQTLKAQSITQLGKLTRSHQQQTLKTEKIATTSKKAQATYKIKRTSH